MTLLLALAVLAQAAGTIRGVVLDTANGIPVGRVSVRLQATGQTVVTTDDGRFELRDVPPGTHELYISAVDFILVKRAVTVDADVVDVTVALSEGTGTLAETVDVRATSITTRREPGVAAEHTLAGRELQQLRGTLTNDPLRAVQVMPAVATGDDFRSEFAIRGLGVDRMTFTFEGIATPFLLHTVQQVHDSGSVAMVNGDVLDEIALTTGAYPQRHGNRLGSEIDFRMRDGSRARVQSHLSVSAIDASAVVEGPVGAGKRGAWLVAARKSYLDLLVTRLYPEQNIAFGFTDAQAKATYDLNARHQLSVAITAGQSTLEREPDTLGPGSLRSADNRSAVGVMSWRLLASPRFQITQRLAATTNTFDNASRDGAELDAGDAHELVYRADMSAAASPSLLVEGGGELRRTTAIGREQRLAGGRFQLREAYDSAAITSSAYALARVARQSADASTGPRANLTVGVRADHWSLLDRATVSPWAQAAAPLTATVTLRGGASVSHQEPTIGEVLGSRGSDTLRPERAYHADAGVEGRIGVSARWQITAYNREDRDLLRLPGSEPQAVGGTFVPASLTSRYRNSLDGYARGVEWLLQRQSPNGFSGWISYALGYSRYRDATTGEAFWGDYDQRHTVNVFGLYRVSDRLSVSARFRYGSNFPTTGYWGTRDDDFIVSTSRNALRVPAYARIDVRANRTFTWNQKRLTLFVEAINVANRDNARFALPSVNRQTLIATGLYDTMVPLLPSVGILLEF